MRSRIKDMSDHLILKGTMSFSLGPGNQNIKKPKQHQQQTSKQKHSHPIVAPLFNVHYLVVHNIYICFSGNLVKMNINAKEFHLYINHELHCMLNSLKYMKNRL